MSEDKLDRRIQRTRKLLQTALMQLIQEKGYDAVTIQDITDKANLGRTTFYLHYETKDSLLLDHHADFSRSFDFMVLTAEELKGEKPQNQFVQFLQQLQEGKFIYFAIKRSKDAEVIFAGIREQMITRLDESIRLAFPGREPAIPRDALLNYIVGAQLAQIDWWLSSRPDYDAEEIATMLHQLQQVAINSAYNSET